MDLDFKKDKRSAIRPIIREAEKKTSALLWDPNVPRQKLSMAISIKKAKKTTRKNRCRLMKLTMANGNVGGSLKYHLLLLMTKIKLKKFKLQKRWSLQCVLGRLYSSQRNFWQRQLKPNCNETNHKNQQDTNNFGKVFVQSSLFQKVVAGATSNAG